MTISDVMTGRHHVSPAGIATAFIATGVAFGVLDGIWLSSVGLPFYTEAIGGIMQYPPRLLAAGLFYVGYIAGLVYFVVLPSARDGGPKRALFQGALLGLMAYGTYDLTNLATLTAFTWKLAAIDMVWGSFASAVSAAVGTAVVRRR